MCIPNDISDHFPIAITVERKNKQQDNSRYNKQPYFFRNLKKFNYDSFIDNLQSSINTFRHFLSFKYSNEVDKLFSNFIKLVSATINKHAPLTKASRKKRKLMNKPWIAKGILVSIRRKQKLYINFFKNTTEIEKILYKPYANKLTKVKALSKKLYLKQEIVNSSHDMRKFWCIMKTLLPHKPTRVLPNYIHEEGQIIDTPLDIADKFNNHFCRVGKVLAEKIKPSNLNNFQQYLCNRVCSSMFLNSTNTFEICCIINQLNINKSCGSDGIEEKFIVLASEVLSPVLAILFNACFDFGIFPTCLKTAKVVPVYKADDINEITNYRPISILSVFSKILEKLVHSRTLFF